MRRPRYETVATFISSMCAAVATYDFIIRDDLKGGYAAAATGWWLHTAYTERRRN